MIGQHKFIILIGINCLMLWFHKKNITSHHFLESKFVYQLGLTWIHIIISIIFMIRNHKHILFIGVNDIDALVSKEKLLSLPLLELMFVCRIRQTRIHIIIYILFIIGPHKHILLIRINDIEALVS